MLVFTKSVDSEFRAFWLAPVTLNVLEYSPFWDRIQNGFSFRNSFQRWNCSGKWSSCTNKYQERDKSWLVGVYWSVEKTFLLNLQQNHEQRSPNHCQLQRKQTLTKWRLLFTKRSFWLFSNWFGKYWNNYRPQGRLIALVIYPDGSRLGICHHYSPPFRGIVVYYLMTKT